MLQNTTLEYNLNHPPTLPPMRILQRVDLEEGGQAPQPVRIVGGIGDHLRVHFALGFRTRIAQVHVLGGALDGGW